MTMTVKNNMSAINTLNQLDRNHSDLTKQLQKLSPLQIQTIKLIELPAPELEQRIQKELEENPVLEEVVDDSPEGEEKKNVSLSEYSGSDPTPSYKLYVNNQGKDLKPQYNTFPSGKASTRAWNHNWATASSTNASTR